MFKNLLHFWKGKDFLTQVIADFGNMLNESEAMFKQVCDRILNNKDQPGLEEQVYEIDKKVNLLEREIRKRIMSHLAVQPSVDVPACLLLMSVVKDAERLGDYAKNIFQLTRILEKPIDKVRFTELFDEMDEQILALFAATKDAFINSDEAKAKLAWQYERKIVKPCDQIVEKLSKSSLSVNEAVCFTLIARYFKRIAAHLANIATSVILPISDLDYYDEDKRIEVKE
ncbi:phosphate uptake regulator PhoU [Candidatus Omnitrophota bacterium]